VPRRINQLVNRLLLLGSVEKADLLDVDMLEEVIADLAGDEGVVEASSTGHADEVAAEPSSMRRPPLRSKLQALNSRR
jgi:hypothetical protein